MYLHKIGNVSFSFLFLESSLHFITLIWWFKLFFSSFKQALTLCFKSLFSLCDIIEEKHESLFTTTHFNFLKMTKKQKDVLFTDISYLGIVLFCSPLTRQLDKQFFLWRHTYLFTSKVSRNFQFVHLFFVNEINMNLDDYHKTICI